MNRRNIMNGLARLIGRPLERLQQRFRRARPGSVLILVVALLVLLALMGTAYMASARLERQQAASSGGQRMLLEASETYAKQLADEVQSALATDAGNLVTCPTDNSTGTSVMAARAPGLLPDMVNTGMSSQYQNTPVWPVISRLANRQMESPWTPTLTAVAPNQYSGAGADVYAGPTNIAIQYTNSNADPALAGQTRVFPAFYIYSPNFGGPNGQNPSPDPTHYYVSPVGPAGPYLAGDATGMGIADCALYRLTASPIQGVDFYGGVRVIDNGSAFNINTAWTPSQDSEALGNCFNFFPTDLDLLGMMPNTNNYNYDPNTNLAAAPEMRWIDDRRFQPGVAAKKPPLDDNGKAHNDLGIFNNAELVWMNYGRRLNYPTPGAQLGDQNASFVRTFDDSDTAGLGWHGGLVDLDSPLCKLDDQLRKNLNGTDSIFAGAANAFTNQRNRFRGFAANNAGYWYDWYWNFENARNNNGGGPLPLPISSLNGNTGMGAAAYGQGSSMPFRPMRPQVVGANPVENLCRMIDQAQLPQSVVAAVVTPADVIPANDQIHPHKAGLNTSEFPELWRAFINIMGGTGVINAQTGLASFRVPGQNPDNHTGNVSNGSMFRNVIREPSSLSTKSTNMVSPIDQAALRMNQENVLMLRAALAAVNVLTLRNGNGYAQGTYFIPDPVRAALSLQLTAGGGGGGAGNGGPVQVLVYGVTANPFITEIYCNNDATQHTEDSNHQNEKGIVVVKLYNPYPFPIDLKDYQFAVVDRRSGGTYPNMALKLLDVMKLAKDNSALNTSIDANSTVLVSNYSPSNTNPMSTYWPKATGLDTPPDNLIVVSDLYKVINDGATEPGGELVLLRKLLHGGPDGAEVPVDSYDFTGFKAAVNPLGGKQTKADGWHYLRTSGNSDPKKRWQCVFAGEYVASQAGLGSPRLTSTETETWDPGAGPDAEQWYQNRLNMGSPDATATTPVPFNGIELANADFGGFNKAPQNGLRYFPFGGFSRVGDVVQAPFIGSYVMFKSGRADTSASQKAAPLGGGAKGTDNVVEINPVTIDTCFADDGDQSDDADEQVGRFVPIQAAGNSPIDDYFPYGYFGTTAPAPNDPNDVFHLPSINRNPPDPFTVEGPRSSWRYHFAVGILDQFTVVSNPENDYYPNMSPGSWGAGAPPFPVSNVPGTAPSKTNPTGTANNPANTATPELTTEGLININSASWRVLAAMQMIPRSQDSTGAVNAHLAQLIVRYRDVDDGIKRQRMINGQLQEFKQGHGPFRSLMELNQVFDLDNTGAPDPTRTFRNALGLLPNVTSKPNPTFYEWGNFSPGPPHIDVKKAGFLADPALDNKPQKTFLPATLMVDRISNLVTTRADSFTVYVVVQGWRNAQTHYPELVVQKRLAMIVDRSALGLGGSISQQGIKTYNIPTD
jgi:Tfp pilus assembly protein PilX